MRVLLIRVCPTSIVRSNCFAILWLLVVLGVTLVPLEATDRPPIFCVLCGDGALADGILNAALFLPLGIALSVAGWRPWRAIALGALLSCAVETAQFVIPGRDPSLSDVLCNTLGVVLGVALSSSMPWLWRSTPRRRDALAIAGTLGAAFVLALTGVLLGPSLPEDVYYAGWTPHFGHLDWYGGRVIEASVGGFAISPGIIAGSADVRRRLLSGAPIVVRAIAGPRPSGLAPLFTIHDAHQREIVLIGVDRYDLVYRYRTRAIAAGLLSPELRVRGVFRGIAKRNPLSVTVHREGDEYCVHVNATERCGLGHTTGAGWTLLLGGQPVPFSLRPAVNLAWIAALFVPSGMWTRLRSGFVIVVALALSLTALFILPGWIDFPRTPPSELVGALVGSLAGQIVYRVRLFQIRIFSDGAPRL
jgi:hypothetical protein